MPIRWGGDWHEWRVWGRDRVEGGLGFCCARCGAVTKSNRGLAMYNARGCVYTPHHPAVAFGTDSGRFMQAETEKVPAECACKRIASHCGAAQRTLLFCNRDWQKPQLYLK
jgi:hypothetical protein